MKNKKEEKKENILINQLKNKEEIKIENKSILINQLKKIKKRKIK